MAARQTWQSVTAALALALGACKLPSVNLSTSEPIKVDIDMRLDVYQHNESEPSNQKQKTAESGTSDSSGDSTPEERKKDREADVQTFKNSRLIGERHDGLLAVLEEPAGEAGDRVRQTVARENADRMTEMKALANEQKMSLEEVQKSQGELWANRSFSGEWIEVLQPDGSWKWEQKKK